MMERSGQISNASTYLARPCMIWVATGSCPFGRRCSAIHDPRIEDTAHPSWLPVATSQTNAKVIIDRFATHYQNVVHQEHPLIGQGIWENCRPSQSNTDDMEQVWVDTYCLVTNTDTYAFAEEVSSSPEKLSHLQKLCIVRLLREFDGLGYPNFCEESTSQLHRDYTFTATHSLHSELCMILQPTRYFLLMEVDYSTGDVWPDEIVVEISFEEYKSRAMPCSIGRVHFTPYTPDKVVTAHEIAFAHKGDHTSNLSIWFDALPIELGQSQVKRSRRLKQKKVSQIVEHNPPHADGALISKRNSADFPSGTPDIHPYVPMVPVDDNDKSYDLIQAIIRNRINSIIIENYPSVNNKEQMMLLRMRTKQLKEEFMDMMMFHKKWTFPKRDGMNNITRSSKAPPNNIMPYVSSEKSPYISIWNTFVKNVGQVCLPVNDDSYPECLNTSFFGSRAKSKEANCLPRLKPSDPSSQTNKTWQEVVLGLPGDGKWSDAISLHQKNMNEQANASIETRNLPLSTLHFVQA